MRSGFGVETGVETPYQAEWKEPNGIQPSEFRYVPNDNGTSTFEFDTRDHENATHSNEATFVPMDFHGNAIPSLAPPGFRDSAVAPECPCKLLDSRLAVATGDPSIVV